MNGLGTLIRIVTFVQHCHFEMLFEIFRENLIPRKVKDEGCCMHSARIRGEAVPHPTLPSAFNPWSNLTSEGTATAGNLGFCP